MGAQHRKTKRLTLYNTEDFKRHSISTSVSDCFTEINKTVPFSAKYCDEYHAPVICQENGHVRPTNLTHGTLIRASQTLIITYFFGCVILTTYVNFRMFTHRAVAIQSPLVSFIRKAKALNNQGTDRKMIFYSLRYFLQYWWKHVSIASRLHVLRVDRRVVQYHIHPYLNLCARRASVCTITFFNLRKKIHFQP